MHPPVTVGGGGQRARAGRAGAAGEGVRAERQHARARAVEARHRARVAFAPVLRQLLRAAERDEAPRALPLLAQVVVTPAAHARCSLRTTSLISQVTFPQYHLLGNRGGHIGVETKTMQSYSVFVERMSLASDWASEMPPSTRLTQVVA